MSTVLSKHWRLGPGLLGFIPWSVTFLGSREHLCASNLVYKIRRNLLCFTGGSRGLIHPSSQDISDALGRISRGKKYYNTLLQPAMVQDSFPLGVPARGLSAWTESQIKGLFKMIMVGIARWQACSGAKQGGKHQFWPHSLAKVLSGRAAPLPCFSSISTSHLSSKENVAHHASGVQDAPSCTACPGQRGHYSGRHH